MQESPSIHNSTTKPLPILFVFIAFCIIVIFGILIYFSINHHFATINLLFTPISATATIDGKTYSSGNIRITPGHHELIIEKYGFETISTTLDLSPNQTTSAHFILNPNTDFTANWYNEHPDDAKLAEGINTYAFDSASAKLYQSYPALSKLPIKTDHFSLYQSSCTEETACILIDANPAYYESAIDYFKTKIDPNMGRYQFIFKDYFNPFKGEG